MRDKAQRAQGTTDQNLKYIIAKSAYGKVIDPPADEQDGLKTWELVNQKLSWGAPAPH